MSIPVALPELGQALQDYGFAYLLTVGQQGTPRVLAVQPRLEGDILWIDRLGRSTAAQVQRQPAVTLSWPPRVAGGYSLIVDGTAALQGEALAITPGHAVLHRPAPGQGPARPDGKPARKHPFAELVGLRVDAQQTGSSTLSLSIGPQHLNPHGVVHGAVSYALADTGMGVALYPTLDPGQICATIDIGMHYFKPVVGPGELVCHTELVNRGKRVAHLRSHIHLGELLVASASGNYAILEA